ncbi:Uncharacterised protein [Serratia proteamaculans]|nr:Uncharacterised protein [Serratia proteamaculans]
MKTLNSTGTALLSAQDPLIDMTFKSVEICREAGLTHFSCVRLLRPLAVIRALQ